MHFRLCRAISVIAISCLVLCTQTVLAASNPKVAPKSASIPKDAGNAKSGNNDEITKTNEEIKASHQKVQEKLGVLSGIVGFEDDNLSNTPLLPKQEHQQETETIKDIKKDGSGIKKKLDEFDGLRKEMVEVMPQTNNPALREITEQYVKQTKNLLKTQQGETLDMLKKCEEKVSTLSQKLKSNAEKIISSVENEYKPVLKDAKGTVSTTSAPQKSATSSSGVKKPATSSSGAKKPAKKAVGSAKKKAGK